MPVSSRADQKTKKPWIRRRHRVVTAIARPIMALYCRLAYGWRAPKKSEWITEQSLVLLNHQTPMDQFFVGMLFRDPLYYVATEDIFSNGLLSRLIEWAVAPIPIKKQTTDPKAVMTCLRIARAGGSICLAPEGNRTYSGKTEYMNPAIGGLAKKLGLPIVLVAIDGGYGKEPRWSDSVRSGKLTVRVTRTISPEEAKAMTGDALFAAIRDGITVNEARRGPQYRGKHLAEHLERAVYICPKCGIGEFASRGDVLTCTHCGAQTRYNPDKTLTGLNWDCPFEFVNDWYEYQKSYVNQYDPRVHLDAPLCTDLVDLSRVHLYEKKERLLQSSELRFYGDRLELDGLVLPFAEISVLAVLGRNKLNIYHESGLYQVKGGKQFNALKYVQLYYRVKNLNGGDENGQFLGL